MIPARPPYRTRTDNLLLEQRPNLCQHFLQNFRRKRVHFHAPSHRELDYMRLIAANNPANPGYEFRVLYRRKG